METVHCDELLSAADSAPTGDDCTNNIDFTLGLSYPASHLEPLRHFYGPVFDPVSDIPLAGSVRAGTVNDDGDSAPYDLGAWPGVAANALVPAQQIGLPFRHQLTPGEGFSSGLSGCDDVPIYPLEGILDGEDVNFGPSASVFRLNSFGFGLLGGDSTSSPHSSSPLGSRNVDVIPAFEFSSSPVNWVVGNPLQSGHEHGLTLWDARDLPVSTPQSLTSSPENSSDSTASSTDPIPLVPRPETAYKRSKDANRRPIKCQHCNEEFGSERSRTRHTETCHPEFSLNKQGPYICRCCHEFKGARKDNFRRHVRGCHRRLVRDTYLCACGNEHIQEKNLILQHLETCGRGIVGRPRRPRE